MKRRRIGLKSSAAGPFLPTKLFFFCSFFPSGEAKMTFVRPAVAVNVLLSGSCSCSSLSQIIYGGKSGFLSEGSRGHPPRLHQSNLSTWPQHLSAHKSAESPWHSCVFLLFFSPWTSLHLQVTCSDITLFFCSVWFSSFFFSFFFRCLFDPTRRARLEKSPIGCFLIRVAPHTSIPAGFLVI